jgi:ABC-type sugar transport system permease subunit
MYQTAFESNDFNLASASAVILFLIVLILTMVNFRSLLQREFSGESGA